MTEPVKTARIYRCVSWVAVSSEPQAERESPAEQRRRNEDFVQNLHHYFPGARGVIVSTIEVVHGRSVDFVDAAARAMPEYAALVKLIKEHLCDLVVCRSRDRLGRRSTLVDGIERLCMLHHVVVVPRLSLPRTIDAHQLYRDEGLGLLATIEAQMAENEIRRLVARNEMGMQARVLKRRQFPGQLPYGYAYADEASRDKVVLDQPAADIVRHIFLDLYLDQQLSTRQIAAYLRQLNAKNKHGEPWTDSNVRRLIRLARRYAGHLELNCVSPTGRSYVHVQGHYPPLLTGAELRAIEAIRQARQSQRTHAASSQPFCGIAFCARCGRALTGYERYRESSTGLRFERGMRCPRGHCSIVESRLFDAAKRTVAYLEMLPENDLVLEPQDTPVRRMLQQQMAEAQQQLRQLQARKERLNHAYVDVNVLTFDDYVAQLQILQPQLESAEQAMAVALGALDEYILPARRQINLTVLRQASQEMLARWESDPATVAAWLRSFLRIQVGVAGQIEAIEYI